MSSHLKIFPFLFFIFSVFRCYAQPVYQFDVLTTPAGCEKGSAALTITGTENGDIVIVNWSTGQSGVNALDGLKEGNYSVSVDITHKPDTITYRTDTTLYFTVGKEMCKITVGAYFTPNGDNYNDFLYLVNSESYPNFQLDVYNKWGQKVHSQTSKYVPWDGKSAGIDVP
ncbi:MAG: gliding motility-associated C-terminal domain-containing protein, partial [Bacteroidota bacterium]